jgi:hypothetical protein
MYPMKRLNVASARSTRLRLVVLAALAAIVIILATTAQEPTSAPLAIASPTGSPLPSPTATSAWLWVGPAPTLNEARTPRPSTTCRVLRTPEPNNPPHAPVNGQPSLGVPTLSGVILVQIAQCRDIQAILVKYGLAGPATRHSGVLESDETIANGAVRWYRVEVTPGTESVTVVRLYQHPEDIEYVQLLPEFTGGAAG